MPQGLHSQLKEHVNNVRMVVSPLWRGQGNIHGLGEQSYRSELATVQAPGLAARNCVPGINKPTPELSYYLPETGIPVPS